MKYVFWPRFNDEIIAFTTMRTGGFSTPPYDTLNLAFHVGDDPANVAKNRHKLFSEFGFNDKNTVIVHQFHSDIALEATNHDAGKGFNSFESGVRADALFTSEKMLTLGIYHADCVPVFIYLPTVKVVALIHAGEAGSLAQITKKTVDTLMKKYAVKGCDVFAFLGPTLKFGHRKISQNHAMKILKEHPELNYAVKGAEPEYFLDLVFLNFMDLRHLGVPSKNIDIHSDCTYENEQAFFSYEREKTTGRMMSFIQLR